MMDWMEIIRTRRSIRTFDERMPGMEDLGKLAEYVETISNPWRIPVEFVFLDTEEYKLSTPVIRGEKLYVAGKVPRVRHAEEAFGYSFEQFVLYAWSLGIGTTWIGGTMKREDFEKAAFVQEGEVMCCISPVGYPAARMSLRETAMRKGVRADHRKKASDLFFDSDWNTPLISDDPQIQKALEAVRLAPSAVNKQPWRILCDQNKYHFYVRHDKGYSTEVGEDMQKIDMGIALNHFMLFAEGTLSVEDPAIAIDDNMEYIATVTL